MALKPWTAEVAVDARLAGALIEEQFPQLAPAQVRRLGEGWDNAVFLMREIRPAKPCPRRCW